LADEGYSPEEMIQYSLFPRLNPTPDNCERDQIILRTQAIVHPNFIPFETRVHLSSGRDISDNLENLYEEISKRTHFEKSMAKIEAIRNKYYDIGDRSSRLLFLHTYLNETAEINEGVPQEPFEFKQPSFPKKEYMKFLETSTTK
jgi:hypothetical protein